MMNGNGITRLQPTFTVKTQKQKETGADSRIFKLDFVGVPSAVVFREAATVL